MRKRIVSKKKAAVELSPEEVTSLEQISQRYEQSERAWQLLAAPPGGDETWHQVEDHILARGGQDQERRWKYFSK